MRPTHHRLFLALLVLFLMDGCQSAIESITTGADYFPLETGHYTIYEVEEEQYSLNGSPVKRSYQLKEVVGDAYADVTGQTAFRLLRYRRSGASQPWQTDSIWSARLVNNQAIRTENGVDFVKLLFPVSDQLKWDGNRLNSAGVDDYRIRNSGQPYLVFDKQYDETVTVVAQNDSTLVLQDKRIEVYARQAGLIYKERTQLQFCSSTPACIGKYQIDYGIRQIYRILQYGNE